MQKNALTYHLKKNGLDISDLSANFPNTPPFLGTSPLPRHEPQGPLPRCHRDPPLRLGAQLGRHIGAAEGAAHHQQATARQGARRTVGGAVEHRTWMGTEDVVFFFRSFWMYMNVQVTLTV